MPFLAEFQDATLFTTVIIYIYHGITVFYFSKPSNKDALWPVPGAEEPRRTTFYSCEKSEASQGERQLQISPSWSPQDASCSRYSKSTMGTAAGGKRGETLTTEPDTKQHQEGGVVPGPLVLRLLAIVEIPVHSLGGREQVEHLPGGELEIHLTETEEPAQVLVALGAGRMARRIPGAQRPVALRQRVH